MENRVFALGFAFLLVASAGCLGLGGKNGVEESFGEELGVEESAGGTVSGTLSETLTGTVGSGEVEAASLFEDINATVEEVFDEELDVPDFEDFDEESLDFGSLV